LSRAAELSKWRKRMVLSGGGIMLLGIPTTILSSAWIAAAIHGSDAPDVVLSSLVGSAGVLAIVMGGYMARLGFAGPFPRRFTEAEA
jgi:hypothetical protein